MMTTAYRLVDYLKMRPGSVLNGLVRVGTAWKPAFDWSLPEWGKDWKSIKESPFLEHRTRWRQHLRKHSRMVGQSRVYRPPVELINTCQQEKRTIGIRFVVGEPIGIYLGHIIRVNGVSLVNVLTNEGHDVWL